MLARVSIASAPRLAAAPRRVPRSGRSVTRIAATEGASTEESDSFFPKSKAVEAVVVTNDDDGTQAAMPAPIEAVEAVVEAVVEASAPAKRKRKSKKAEPAEEKTPPASGQPRVVVLGGAGFVGSRVVSLLREQGAAVTVVGKTERLDDEAFVQADLTTDDGEAALASVIQTGDICVSCVGALSSDALAMRNGNGKANVMAAKTAKAAGASRFVYLSVASDVRRSVEAVPGGGGGALKAYLSGKGEAEDAISDAFADFVFVGPSFIYGGDTAGLLPPRLPATAGDALVKVLSGAPFEALRKVAPAPLKLALEPPVQRDVVAKAVCAAALGRLEQSGEPLRIDGAQAISDAAIFF